MEIETAYLAKLSGHKLWDLSSFEAEHFKWAWPSKFWNELASSSRNIICLWQEEDSENGPQLISLCVFEVSPPELCHLYKIVVDERFRRKKLAYGLYHQMCRIASMELGTNNPQIYLEVEQNNEGAIGFYEKMGLEQIHVKRGFYQNGSAAVIMQGVHVCDKP